jgi:hypothetical protein
VRQRDRVLRRLLLRIVQLRDHAHVRVILSHTPSN